MWFLIGWLLTTQADLDIQGFQKGVNLGFICLNLPKPAFGVSDKTSYKSVSPQLQRLSRNFEFSLGSGLAVAL